MLLRDHVINALKFMTIGTPLTIGDLVGEDKFRVHEILIALERDGLVSPFFSCGFVSRCQAANRQLYVPGKDPDRDVKPE